MSGYKDDSDEEMNVNQIEKDNEVLLDRKSHVQMTKTNGRLQVQIVTPGELIVKNASNALCGHGTFRDDQDQLLSSVCGIVERVNKLISVRPLRARYPGEVGDVVVGRITEITGKRWKVDIQARQDAVMLLSSVNLPGGVQRRKTNEDQLNMRSVFAENDLIVAEVHSRPNRDGSLQLQTRSSRYGKLENGVFVRVYAALVKRCTQHFHTFDFGVQVILGNNGYIWITKKTPVDENKQKSMPFYTSADADKNEAEVIEGKDRENICRVRNAILALQSQFLPIYPATILDVIEMSKGMESKEMTLPDITPLITKNATARIQKKMEEEDMEVVEGGY
ncbi:exosome complex protein RPR4 [Acrasis kona]|uniref:Exosome complex protein RPR4 n=1 Tax=Acrasis kona TaxID=1008807 RepID=A0AAW2YN37_9EUKA